MKRSGSVVVAATPPRLIVKMSVKSEVGRELLSSLAVHSGGEGGMLWRGYWDTSIIPENGEGKSGSFSSTRRYSLRARERHIEDDPTETGSGTAALLNLPGGPDIGHPAARGCVACWELSHECSLLGKPLVYPCQVCREDQVDCELFIQPTWKRPCEDCKRRKKICSYNTDADHSLPCLQCRELGIHCVAGPAKYVPEPGDVRFENAQEGEGKEMVDEEVGDGSDIKDSLSETLAETKETIPFLPDTGGSGPVEEQKIIDSSAIAATELATSQLKKNTANTPPAPAQSETRNTPKGPATSTSTPGPTRIIQTSFAHPINFAYEPPEDGTYPCHWCHNFLYGLVGLGKVSVQVLIFDDGKYLELGGGHTSNGHEPSRMCITCALERIHIMTCQQHQISPLKGYDINNFDFDAAYASLVPGQQQQGGRPKILNPWCSLCPNPAFFGCSTIQTVDKFQEPVEPGDPAAAGCGLLLCESCALLMRRFEGDLGLVVAENERRDDDLGSRADVVYLLPGNDLYQFYAGL